MYRLNEEQNALIQEIERLADEHIAPCAAACITPAAASGRAA